MPVQFKYNNEIKDAAWGMDYVVDEEHRGSIAGVQLCKKALKENLHFGIGLSDVSLKMHLIFNERVIGKMTKFVKIHKVFSLVNRSFKKNTRIQATFPEKIQVGNNCFYKVHRPEEIKSDNGYWHEDQYLEFSRNNDFLKWRFFYYQEKYTVYKLQDDTNNFKSVYFVLKNIVWKNLNCFLLVDYRINANRDFQNILKAVSKLAKINNIAATITGSSLDSLDKELKKKLYFPYGSRMDIVTNFKDILSANELENSKVMVTFADADCEHYYGSKEW